MESLIPTTIHQVSKFDCFKYKVQRLFWWTHQQSQLPSHSEWARLWTPISSLAGCRIFKWICHEYLSGSELPWELLVNIILFQKVSILKCKESSRSFVKLKSCFNSSAAGGVVDEQTEFMNLYVYFGILFFCTFVGWE